MPATTRSCTKQARIDNPDETKAAVTGSKRKAAPVKGEDQQPKKQRATSKTSSTSQPSRKDSPHKDDPAKAENGEDEDSILINRAPVLELWAASVASFLYPSVSWQTCLSAGSAISALCAISKGRSIGTIEKPDPAAAEEKKKKRQHADSDSLDSLEVMGFQLKLQDGQALVSDKPKKANEALLQKKFGDEAYEKVRSTFRAVLQTWKGQEDDLDSRAFHCYEDFRPSVPKGQKGWGRKGMLNLQAVKDAVSSG